MHNNKSWPAAALYPERENLYYIPPFLSLWGQLLKMFFCMKSFRFFLMAALLWQSKGKRHPTHFNADDKDGALRTEEDSQPHCVPPGGIRRHQLCS